MPRHWLFAALLSCRICAAGETPTIDEAFRHLYNFDFQASHEVLDRYIEAHPQEPLPYSVRASVYLFHELDRLAILESEFLIDDKRIVDKKKLQPDPAIRAHFYQALDDVQKRGETALRADPQDRAALLAMCIAQGVTSDYMALVEKRQFSSLSPARRTNEYAQRLLKLDPKFYDAYLAAGLSEYMVGSLPYFIRWFVHFENVEGSRHRGVEILEVAALEGRYLKPFAKILLGIIDLREKRYHDAQRRLIELAHDYPENPLFRRELVKLNARIGVAAN